MRVTPQQARQSAPLFVEFVGAPGSGKTRVAAEVTSLLRASGTVTADALELERLVRARFVGRSKLATFVRWAGYLLVHPAWAIVTARWLATRDGTRVIERIVRVTHRVRALSAIAGRQVDVWVADEWILHEIALATAGAVAKGHERGLALADAALGHFPLRLLVVHCEVDPAVAADRVVIRKSSSDLDGRPAHNLLPTLRELSDVATALRERATFARHATIVVPTDEPVAASALVVVSAIRKLTSNANRAGAMPAAVHAPLQRIS